MGAGQTLVMAVMGRQAAQFGGRSRKVFAGCGGTIGRSEDCDWVLSAAGVSRVHAKIRYLNGIYFIEDTSTNGMLLNGVPLTRGDPAALKDGDRLQIDTFEMAVNVGGDVEALAPVGQDEPDMGLSDLLPDHGMSDGGSIEPKQPATGLIPDDVQNLSAVDLDPLSFLTGAFGSESPSSDPSVAAPSSDWNHSSAAEDYFRPPRVMAPTGIPALPEDWDKTKGDFTSRKEPIASDPAISPAAVSSPSSPVGPSSVGAQVPSALSPELAQMFHIIADGLMDVLRTRAEIKINFRLPVTIVQRSENNPLKFAATAEEAMQKILMPPNSAFLSGPSAFEDAFDDIRCHQMAMLAGMRAGFDAVLVHFSPDRLERDADGAGRRTSFTGKGRYWERYREQFESLMKDPDECFRRLFGDEFARAYEAQLSRLKSVRKAAR